MDVNALDPVKAPGYVFSQMPTYEYACGACGHAFERMQSMTDAPVRTCPECHKRRVKRVIGSGGGLLFKGSGFYITDYRSKGYQDKAKADSEASKPKPETKPDAKPKPESKPDPKPSAPKAG